MILKKIILFFCLLFIQLTALAQLKSETELSSKDTALVNSLIKQSSTHFNDDRGQALNLAIQAKALAEKIG